MDYKYRKNNVRIAYLSLIILSCIFVVVVVGYSRLSVNKEYKFNINFVKKSINDNINKLNSQTKLATSTIVLKADSSNLKSDNRWSEQYENTVSYQLTKKESIFITDINDKFRKRLNLYAWRDLKSGYVEILKGITGFPFNPMMKDYVTNLSISRKDKYTHGKRIFGYLTTPVAGNYTLAVSSSHNSELWISTNHNPELASKVAWVGSWKGRNQLNTPLNALTQFKSQQTHTIHLNANQLHYIELMHASNIEMNHIQLFWARVDINSTANKEFTLIEAENLVLHHLYMDDKLIAESRPHETVWPMHKQTIFNVKPTPDHRIEMIKLPVLREGFLQAAIENCEPMPQNVKSINVDRYGGYKKVAMYSLFPEDGTQHYEAKSSHSNWISKNTADQLIHKLTNQLKSNNFSLLIEEILNLEIIHYTVTPGARVLVEAKVRLTANNKTVYRMSEYLFLPKDSSNFCYLPDFQWKRNSFIYTGIVTKNQGYWVRDVVEKFERLQKNLSDEDWGLMISDYESTDMDILTLLAKSRLRHWKYIRLRGTFSRSHGINAFLNEIDSNMIGLACDLQLDIPLNYFDVIRTHTIQGVAVTAPIVMRLSAGHFYSNPYGFWEYLGYGQIGMYIHDWIDVGGMNTIEYSNRWGGEDWELIDRCVLRGVEVQRMLIRNFYHYYHTKQGTWDSKTHLSIKYFN